MKKRVKEGSALLLTLAVTFMTMALPQLQAANAVETDRTDCTMEFSITGEYDELRTESIPVILYKVASIDASGKYKTENTFQGVDVEALDEADAAAVWLARADEAFGKVTDTTPKAGEAAIEQGKAVIGQLPVGLYLVAAQEITTDFYRYRFQPYLISLPNNYYYSTGDDTWVYELTGTNALGLKPERQERFGDLRINKTLENQNITMGERASFVFKAVIVTPAGDTYFRHAALTFGDTVTESAVLEQIPAGSKVTVTEVYSGASYELTTAESVETVILADEEVEVSFANAHDGRRVNGGYGTINHYEVTDGQYHWTQQSDSAGVPER